jgi:hypothetical protein
VRGGQVFFSGELPLYRRTDEVGFLCPCAMGGGFQPLAQLTGKPHGGLS